MENRRIHKRFKLHQLVEISNSKEESFINVYSVNISLSGLLCKVKTPIKTNSEIYIMFELQYLENPHVIKCYGEISWKVKENDFYLLGINFKHLSDFDSMVIQEHIEHLIEIES